MVSITKALRWRTETAGRDIGVRLGVLPYRPVTVAGAPAWDDDYRAGRWDRLADRAEAARYSVLAGYLGLIGGDPDVLDVGCGAGLFRAALGGRAFHRYVGVDVSAAAVERAQVLADERTRFLVTPEPMEALGTFDVVVCSEMLYFIESPGELLDGIRRILRPGGSLLSSNWRHGGDVALHQMIDRRFALVDRVDLRNEKSPWLRWRISWHRHQP